MAAGADPVVRRTTTDETGSYSVALAGASGQYYAVAPRGFEEGVAECSRVQSANLTVG